MLIAWTESIRYKIILFASQPSYHFTYMRCKDVWVCDFWEKEPIQ